MSDCRPHFTIDWNTLDVMIGQGGTCTVTGNTFKTTDITVRAYFRVDMECGTGHPFPKCELPEICSNVGGDNCTFPKWKVKIWEIRDFANGVFAGGDQGGLKRNLKECQEKWRHTLFLNGRDFYTTMVVRCLETRLDEAIKEGTFDWQLGSWYNWYDHDIRQDLSEMYGDCCDCIVRGHSPNVRSWDHYDHSENIGPDGRIRRD